MNFVRRTVLSILVGSLAWVSLRAQSTVLTLSQPIGSQTLAAGGAAASFDLRSVFTFPGVSGPVTQFDTVLGKFNVELRAAAAPRHTANFLAYVEAGAYTNTVFHRAASFETGVVSILQGGGRRTPITNGDLPQIQKFAPIALEYNLPNERGSLAAARTSDVNSATSEWYFNVRDNSTTLGPSNGGGYSVFGRVIGSGMSVVDALAALPRVNAGGIYAELPVRNYTSGAITDANLVTVSSITALPIYPTTNDTTAVLGFTVNSTNSSVASVALAGSSLAVTPRAAGTTNITVRASDTNGNSVENTFAVSVVAGPTFSAQPQSQSANVGGSVVLSATATGATSYQWTRNGVNIAGATSPTYAISNVQPEHAGIYVAVAGNGSVTSSSQPAIVGVRSSLKVEGAGEEVGPNIVHQNQQIYDQVLLKGAAATVKADPGQVLRISYLDTSDDIVQVEFSGAGNLTVALDNASAAAPPAKYNQSNVSYVKGRATIVLAGADATTNLTVFSVGRGTAVNQGLFRDDETYDGMADIAAIAITSTDGNFAGLRAANTRFSASSGITGLYAPGVEFDLAFIGDISASATATPMISLASVPDGRVTGGDLFQDNAFAIKIDGLTRLAMTAGSDSHDRQQAAQSVRGRLERNGADVTQDVIVPAN